MEEQVQDRPGLFGRIRDIFVREEEIDEEGYSSPEPRYHSRAVIDSRELQRVDLVIRRQIVSFDDALAAAQGLKEGQQQILNLTLTEPTLREKIKDFMCGVNFSQDGTWEEVGDHIYIVVPSNIKCQVAPPSGRTLAGKN